MLKLSSDETFHFECLRVLASGRYYGSDIGEVLNVAPKIIPGDFESWYTNFRALAEWVLSTVPSASENEKHHPVSVRDAMFRASNYFRAADFFLHGDPADERILELWKLQTECFDRAISLLPVPGQRAAIKADGFDVPTIFYRASSDGRPRPTILMCNGYDGSQEEMLHVSGFAALERDFNVLTFEGPGQPSVVRYQKKPFIAEWEKVVGPILDYCKAYLPEVDGGKIALLGYSMGAFLVTRAAAFEHRLAAVICVDGLYDVYEGFTGFFPSHVRELLDGPEDEFNHRIRAMGEKATGLSWSTAQGTWSFMNDSPFQVFQQLRPMTMAGIAHQIKCPVWVGDGLEDHFFKGQPKKMSDALGERATRVEFTAAEAAGVHCQIGASVLMNQRAMDWTERVFGGKKE